MEIKPNVTEIPPTSVSFESKRLPQLLNNSLGCESEVNELVGKKREQMVGGSKEFSEMSEFSVKTNDCPPSVPEQKGIYRYKIKLSNIPLLLCDQKADTSSREQLRSLPLDHSSNKVKMQHMNLLSPGRYESKAKVEHFKTCIPDQSECLYVEQFKSSVSDLCASKTRLKHVKSPSYGKFTKKCKKEFTLTSFLEKAACQSIMASDPNTLLVMNGKQIPCLPAQIKTEQFDTSYRCINYNQLPNVPQDKTEELEVQNPAAIEDFHQFESNKTTRNSSLYPRCSRVTDSSIDLIHLQNHCELSMINKPSLMLSHPTIGPTHKSPRSVPMREAVDPSKYTKVPHGDGFKFKCSNCGNVYKWRKSLNKHWKEKHDMLWLTSTTVTGRDRKLVCPVNVDCSVGGSSLQGRALTSAEYTRNFPYSFYGHSSQLPFPMDNTPSTGTWNHQLTDPLNFRNNPSSTLLSGFSESSSVRNLQIHDDLSRHMKDFCGTKCQSNHKEDQIFAGDLLLKMPSSDAGARNISLMTTGGDKSSTVCPDISGSSDPLMDCILDLSNKDQPCVLVFPDLLSSFQEYPLDLSMKSAGVLQGNFTKNASTGPSSLSSAVPCLSVEGALCSTQSKTWPFCSRCSVRFSSVQGLKMHFLKNHSKCSIEQSDSAGNIEVKILPKIDNPIRFQPSMYQSSNAGNTCFICHVCFLTRQKLAEHFDKDHQHIRPNPYQGCLCCEVPVSSVPHIDKNHHKASTKLRRQNESRVVTSGCFRDALTMETSESGCSKSISKEIIPLNIGLIPNRTVSSFSDPSGMQTEEFELEASEDGIRNSNCTQKRRWASLSCIGLQDHLEAGATSDAANLCENTRTFSYNAMHNARTLPSFTDLVTHDALVNSETLTTLRKLGTRDIIPNAVNRTLNQHVIHDAKTNIETLLSSSKEVKRGLGKTARHGRKDTGIGDRNLRYKCDFCDFRARWPSEMTQHKKNHSADKPFKCNYCSYRSKWKWDVRKHLKRCGSEHQKLKKGVDAVCESEPVAVDPDSSIQMPSQRAAGTSLDSDNTSGGPDRHARRSAMRRNLHHLLQHERQKSKGRFGQENHVWSVNRGGGAPAADTKDMDNRDKGHSCSHCDFIGQSATELKHHSQVHMHVKPYMCKMCSYSTKWKSDLKKHMRTLSHEIHGALRSTEASCTSGCSVLNHAVHPPSANVESKEDSSNSGKDIRIWNDSRNGCNVGRIVFLDGRLQCRFCNYNSVEITMSQNHKCSINDRKASKNGLGGDQLAFLANLALRRRTSDKLKPADLMDAVEKLEEAGTTSCLALNGNVSVANLVM